MENKKYFNWGKFLVLVFCFITVLPMCMLLIFSISYIAINGRFNGSTLGNLLNLWE